MLNVISLLLNVFVLLLVARAIMSWVRLSPESPFRPVSDFIYRVTEPVLAPIRSVLPAMGGFDLSPLIVIVVIRIIQGQL
ncbi:MAG: YggT family protein [Acidimicrobiales bacterium]